MLATLTSPPLAAPGIWSEEYPLPFSARPAYVGNQNDNIEAAKIVGPTRSLLALVLEGVKDTDKKFYADLSFTSNLQPCPRTSHLLTFSM